MTTPDRLAPVLADALAGSDVLLEEVTVTPAGHRKVVRVIVDRDLGAADVVDTATDPLSLDDVAAATHVVSAALDDSDVMGEAPYTLEVSSPGVSRPLVERRHFARNVGRLVTFVGDGEPVTGRIQRVDDDGVTLEVPAVKKQPARTLTLPLGDIRRGEVQIEFNRPGDADDEDSDLVDAATDQPEES
jgi:ribosome maturation factor RimP